MNIVYSDESDNLTPEIWNLIRQAADVALEKEFGEELAEAGIDASDVDAEIGVSIVTDNEIRELNSEHRGKDKVTDVLSFPQFAGHDDLYDDLIFDDSETLIGDVVISYDQAMRQADEYGTGMTREILYLFVHSLMHLFGYDHMDEEERQEMRIHEEAVLESIGVAKK